MGFLVLAVALNSEPPSFVPNFNENIQTIQRYSLTLPELKVCHALYTPIRSEISQTRSAIPAAIAGVILSEP
jgi:hypothetical protein